MTNFTITVSAEYAEQVANWIDTGRGVAHWRSVDLSDLGANWLTPGDADMRPHWKADRQPAVIEHDPEKVGVIAYEEATRYRVGIRLRGNGTGYKVTDASSDRIRRSLRKYGEGSTYYFDYETQEAVILAPLATISLPEWIAGQPEMKL